MTMRNDLPSMIMPHLDRIQMRSIKESGEIPQMLCRVRMLADDGHEIDVSPADAESIELLVFDHIGEDWCGGGVVAKNIANQISSMSNLKTVHVRINSMGGSVIDAAGIYNVLVRHSARVEVDVEGYALSAASYLAMAGDVIRIAANGMMMIHNPWVMAFGDPSELRKTADVLDAMKETIVATYVARNTRRLSRAKISEMMDAETWMTAREAVDLGFADSINELKHAPDDGGNNWGDARNSSLIGVPLNFAVRMGFKNIPRSLLAINDQFNKKCFTRHKPQRQENQTMADNRPASIKDLKSAFRNDPEYALECAEKNLSLIEAKAQYADVLAARLQNREEELEQIEEDLAEVKKENEDLKEELEDLKEEVEKLKEEEEVYNKRRSLGARSVPEGPSNRSHRFWRSSNEDDDDVSGDPIEEFSNAVNKRMKSGLSRDQAVVAVAKSNPELHCEYLAATNPHSENLIRERFSMRAAKTRR